MKKTLLAFFGCIGFLATALAGGQPVRPSVYALDPAVLQQSKTRIAANDPAVMPAYKELVKDAGEALQFGPVSVMEKKNNPPSGDRHDYMSLAPYFWPDPSKPDGLPYIRKDGQTNPEVKEYKDKEYLPKLCESVYTLGLAWYFSGEKKYAEHACRLLRVWFLDTATRMNPNLNFGQAVKGVNTGRGAGMIDTRHFVKLIDGIQLLETSRAWTKNDQLAMQQWFRDFLQWMQTSTIGRAEMAAGNNHGAWYDAQRLSMALYTGNETLAKEIISSAESRLDKQMDNDGSFPREMERTISLHYTVFALEAFFNIAQMAASMGNDFWHKTTASGKSLEKAFTVVRPYLAKEKEWTGQQIKPFEWEEGYRLMAEGEKLGCRNCSGLIQSLAGDKAPRMRLVLLYGTK